MALILKFFNKKNFFYLNKLIEIIKYKNFFNLVSISLVISVMEFISIFTIYPVFFYLENEKLINNKYYSYIYYFLPPHNNEVTFEKILLISLLVIFITSFIVYFRFSRKYKIKEDIINRNRKYIFKLISDTNLFYFKKINQEFIKSYLTIETQRISQIILSFTNLCSSLFIIILLTIFIIYIDPFLILILFSTVLILWFLLSKTYADSKLLGSKLANLNNNYVKFIDKLLNDKSQFMLNLNNQDDYILENDVVKSIHFNQFQTQKKSSYIEFIIKVSTLSVILFTVYIFYIKNLELSLILFSGVIFIRLIPYMSQFGNSLQNLKSNFSSIDKLIFIENKLSSVTKIDVDKIKLKSIEIKSNILKENNILKKNNFFKLYPGNIYGLFGPSGIGKTTFVESFLGLDRNSSFEIMLNNYHLISNSNTSNVLANTSYFNQNTISNNFLLSEIFSRLRVSQINRLLKLLKMNTSYSNIKYKKINEFSGGEQQRLNLINILLENKKIIILDEPTSGLDEKISLCVMKVIKDHIKQNNNICIIISHEPIIIKKINRYFNFKQKVNIDQNNL